jgi:hypothetical protein
MPPRAPVWGTLGGVFGGQAEWLEDPDRNLPRGEEESLSSASTLQRVIHADTASDLTLDFLQSLATRLAAPSPLCARQV